MEEEVDSTSESLAELILFLLFLQQMMTEMLLRRRMVHSTAMMIALYKLSLLSSMVSTLSDVSSLGLFSIKLILLFSSFLIFICSRYLRNFVLGCLTLITGVSSVTSLLSTTTISSISSTVVISSVVVDTVVDSVVEVVDVFSMILLEIASRLRSQAGSEGVSLL